jgi:hypothetical protein
VTIGMALAMALLSPEEGEIGSAGLADTAAILRDETMSPADAGSEGKGEMFRHRYQVPERHVEAELGVQVAEYSRNAPRLSSSSMVSFASDIMARRFSEFGIDSVLKLALRRRIDERSGWRGQSDRDVSSRPRFHPMTMQAVCIACLGSQMSFLCGGFPAAPSAAFVETIRVSRWGRDVCSKNSLGTE